MFVFVIESMSAGRGEGEIIMGSFKMLFGGEYTMLLRRGIGVNLYGGVQLFQSSHTIVLF